MEIQEYKEQQKKRYKTLGGEVRRAVTRSHSIQDIGQTFIDNFGRTYVYTKQGLIY